MPEQQQGEEEISLTRGRRDYRGAMVAWILVIVCVGVSAVLAGGPDSSGEEVVRVVMWLPVGIGIGIWAWRSASQLSRWTLALASLVAFSLAVIDVVSGLRAKDAVAGIGLGIAIIVLSFHVLRTMVWNRDAKAYADGRENADPSVDE